MTDDGRKQYRIEAYIAINLPGRKIARIGAAFMACCDEWDRLGQAGRLAEVKRQVIERTPIEAWGYAEIELNPGDLP